MKLKLFMLTALASVLLFAGCKSEAVEKLEESCSKDMGLIGNEKACRMALMINCGGLVGINSVKSCVKDMKDEECAGIPSYCISSYSKAFDSKN